MEKIHITITGDIGSGKSSVARKLNAMLDYKYFSSGQVQRELGEKKNMNTLEMNYLAEQNTDIDEYIDGLVKKINEEDKLYVIDSRLAWHFIKESYKVYLTVDPVVAATRVISDNQRDNEPVVEDIDEMTLKLIERRNAENSRFKQKYGVGCSNMNNYDSVIDTTNSSVDEISKLIYQLYTDHVKRQPH